jgi:serine/threonine-protein kinase
VCRYGREVDFVKVLDFGLVKAGGDERTTELNLTRDQHAGGTPAFMSPEQVLGTSPVDARSDIYAIGCLAYWLVTGELVFAGRTAMETMFQHTTNAPVPPSRRTELAIPEALDRLILDCLAKDPADRPASVDVLAERLGAIPTAERWSRASSREWWNAHHAVGSVVFR